MNQRLQVTGTSQPILQITGNAQPRIDASQVAAALGGEPITARIDGNPASVTLYALRAELFRRRQSGGGRPRIEGTNQRVKIPLSDQDWTELEKLAGELTSAGFSPSPGQIASVLLHAAIQSIRHDDPTKKGEEKLIQTIAQQLNAASSTE